MHPSAANILDAPTVIRAEGVSKEFVLRKDKSLKERLVTFSTSRKHREQFVALDDISFDVKAGTTLALIGHNGSGKSTLLKILGGIIDPSSGKVSRRGRIAALLELGAGFHPDLSGRDNVFLNASLLGLSKSETDAVFDYIVAFAELQEFIDTQVKFYSSGMYVRLAFAVAIHTDPEILLVDEVLAVGDEAFQRKCMDVIRRFQAEGRTILLVTHNLDQVIELADSAVLLHHGRMHFQGEPREAVSQFRHLLEENRQQHAEDVSQNEVSGHSELLDISAGCSVKGREAGEPLDLGETLYIDIELGDKLSEADWILSVQIDSSMGLRVFGAASDLIDVELSPFVNTSRFRFTVEDTRFGEGKYFVNVSVLDSDGALLAEHIQATSFDAKAPENSRGVISMNYSLAQIE